MPLITASALTTVGLSLITGAIKYLNSDTPTKAAMDGLDGLFGGVLGNVCHEKFNEYKKHLEVLTVPEHNADIERCSRHALLKALLIFSEAAKEHLAQTTLTPDQQKDCRHFLNEAQKHLTSKLKKLGTLADADAVLQENPLTQDDRLAVAIAKKGQKERLEAMKASLADIPLPEFGYDPPNILYEQLQIWLPQGLPNGRHWFVYYVHELHANLKKDEPPYCRNARRILTQTQLAEISLLTKANQEQLDQLMTLTGEMNTLLERVEERLGRIEEGVGILIDQNERIEKKIDGLKLINFAQYNEYVSKLEALNAQYAKIQRNISHLEKSLTLTADEAWRIETEQQIADTRQTLLTIDTDRQNVLQQKRNLETVAREILKNLDSDLPQVQQANALIEAGDVAGALALLDEQLIDAAVVRADEQQREVETEKQKASQLYLARVTAVVAEAKPDWLTEVARLYRKAAHASPDYDTIFQGAYFLQTYNQYDDALALYRQALELSIDEPSMADVLDNLASLLAKDSSQRSLAKDYYEEALGIWRRLAQQQPAVYEPDVAGVLNNLALLLSKDSSQRTLARDYYEEALGIRRRLAQQQPAVYEPDVTMTLNNLAILLSKDSSQRTLARDYYEEALGIRRRLVQQQPAVYEPDVAGVLNNLALLLAEDPQQWGLARQHHEEALDIWRRLAQQQPAIYEPNVTTTLNNLALLLAEDPQQWGLARQYHEEALGIRRRLARQQPVVYEPDVASTLNNLANLLSNYSSQCLLAKDYYEEALDIRRQLYERHPTGFDLDLATTLVNIALFHTYQQPDEDVAIAAAREGYPLVQPIAAFLSLAAQLVTSCEHVAAYWEETL